MCSNLMNRHKSVIDCIMFDLNRSLKSAKNMTKCFSMFHFYIPLFILLNYFIQQEILYIFNI